MMKRIVELLIGLLLIGLLAACNTPEVSNAQVTESNEDTINSFNDTSETDTTDIPGKDVQVDAPYTVLVVGPYDGSGIIEGTNYVIKENKTYTDSAMVQKYTMTADD